MLSLNMGSLTGKTKAAKTDVPEKDVSVSATRAAATTAATTQIGAYSADTADTTVLPSTLSVEQTTADLSQVSDKAFSTTTLTDKGFPCDPALSTAYVSPSKKTSLVSPIQVGNTKITAVPSMFSSAVRLPGRRLGKSTREYTILSAMGEMVEDTADVSVELGISIETIQFFAALGCTVQDDPDKLYTLVGDQTDQTHVSNPHIETDDDSKNDYGGVAAMDPVKTFPNSSDPFYEESTRTAPTTKSQAISAITRRVQLGEKSVKIAADIATINTGREYDSTLKQFKKTETKKQVVTRRTKNSSGLGLTRK